MFTTHPSGIYQDTDIDDAGRIVRDDLAPSMGVARTLDYTWHGGLYGGRTSAVISESATFDPFGARNQWTYYEAGTNLVGNINVERDIMSRVRKVERFHGTSSTDKLWWKGFEYDLRGALTGSWEMVAPDVTAVTSPSVGYHDTATNTSVRTVAQGLTGGTVHF